MKVEDFQEFINFNKKWERCEQNQGIYNSNKI